MAIKRDGKVIKLSSRKGVVDTSDKRKMTIAMILATIIGLVLVFMPNAYKISINGEFVGAIKDKKVIEGAKNTVITQLQGIYNAEVKFEEELEIEKYRAKKKDYIDQNYLISCMRKKMDILIGLKEIFVEGESVGIVSSEKDVETLKAELKRKYYGDKAVKVDFDKKVEVRDIFAKEEDLISMDRLVQKCTTTTPKSITYTVQAGDSLSSIADRYNITMDSIVSANPGFTKNVVLRVGQVINANINEPLLPLKVVE
ncbi:MAG: LysM peptidoglycan-binding domain-containing protein [Cellulosilyticum sp.]|nr:LysM peptidoglycan-binding domain-containing protein [Cellulosilyticum sp.]